MNDTYCEMIIKRKMTSGGLLARFFAIVATTLVILLGLLVLGVYGLIAGFFLVWLDMVIFRNTDVEYEYQYISGDLDIDVIYGRTKRKRARKFDMRKIEVLAPINSDKIKSIQGNRHVKVCDYSSGYTDRKKYAFITTMEEGEIIKVVFEPTEAMVNAIKFVAPSKVHMY